MAESYKCPGCGASLVYKEGSDSLICPYCNTTVLITEQESKQPEEDAREQALEGREAETINGARYENGAFFCSACGGELTAGDYTAATLCPYCASPVILTERLQGEKRPAKLLGFQIDKEKAREMFRSWTKSGFFTPSVFSKQSTLDKMEGLYVPYWMFDYEASVHMEAAATRVRTEIRGDYRYTHTDHYIIKRETEGSFEKIPADASERMPDDTMERLEPYRYEELKEFNEPYLSGYEAEIANVDAQVLEEIARKRARASAVEETRNTIKGYSSVVVTSEQVAMNEQKRESALFPVWTLQYRYRGKDWKLYINGQTGKKIGKLPIHWGKAAAFYIATSGLCSILSYLIMMWME